MIRIRSLIVVALPTVLFAADVVAPPATPKRPVTDEYHGVTVVDDYRWLENAADPAVKKWTTEQNESDALLPSTAGRSSPG